MKIADFIESTYGKHSDKVSTSYSSLRRLFRASEETITNVASGKLLNEDTLCRKTSKIGHGESKYYYCE